MEGLALGSAPMLEAEAQATVAVAGLWQWLRWWWRRRFLCSLAGSWPCSLGHSAHGEVLALAYRTLFSLCRRRALTPPTRS